MSARLAGFLLGFALVAPATATAQNQTTTGTMGYQVPPSESVTITFSCTGAPTCVGTYTIVEQAPQCSNIIVDTKAFTMTGLNLAQSGTIAGNVTLTGAENTLNRAQDGTCTIAPGATDAVLPYTGTWNATTRVASFNANGGHHVLQGSFTSGANTPAPNPNTLVTGSIISSGTGGYDENTKITCRGAPTCIGTYQAHVREQNCPNYLDWTGTFTINGLQLFQSGNLQGTIVVTSRDIVRQPGGPCTLNPQSYSETLTYTGSWNATTRQGTIRGMGTSPGDVFDINFTADPTAPQPVFPLTVDAQIGPVTTRVTASLQFRPQDVGRNGSIFVFASAPAAKVQGGLAAKAIQLGNATGSPKADPQPCVLAQVSAGGQLQAVTTSQLAAFYTGLLSAAGNSVSILNNTPTPNVSGATFYVGYGSNSSTMLSEGIFRNAVLIPGDSVCPMLPYTTALWLNTQESGWGLNISQQGSIAFATLFTYDAGRAPLWLVMSGGNLQPDGLTFSGDLFRTTGPAFSANPFTPITNPPNYNRVGTMSIQFSDVNAGTLRYSVNGVEVQKNITRYQFGSRTANCLPTPDSRVSATNYTDLWAKLDEAGWGLNLTHQDNIIFATLFTYAAGAGTTNAGLWLVMSRGERQGDGSYLGTLYRASGPPFNAAPFTPITEADLATVGTMRLRFTNGETGTVTYTVNGVNVEKAITRLPFWAPLSACN